VGVTSLYADSELRQGLPAAGNQPASVVRRFRLRSRRVLGRFASAGIALPSLVVHVLFPRQESEIVSPLARSRSASRSNRATSSAFLRLPTGPSRTSSTRRPPFRLDQFLGSRPPRGRPGLWCGLNRRVPGRREPGECRLLRRASLCYTRVRALRVSKRARSFPCPAARPILPD